MCSGRVMQQFDYWRDGDEKEFTCAATSPSGQSVVFGSFSRWGCLFTFFECVLVMVMVMECCHGDVCWPCSVCWCIFSWCVLAMLLFSYHGYKVDRQVSFSFFFLSFFSSREQSRQIASKPWHVYKPAEALLIVGFLFSVLHDFTWFMSWGQDSSHVNHFSFFLERSAMISSFIFSAQISHSFVNSAWNNTVCLSVTLTWSLPSYLQHTFHTPLSTVHGTTLSMSVSHWNTSNPACRCSPAKLVHWKKVSRWLLGIWLSWHTSSAVILIG